MKIVYIDTGIQGHNLIYSTSLIEERKDCSVAILPEYVDDLSCKQYKFKHVDFQKRKIREYLDWLNELFSYVEKEKPDIVHFLTGDVFYRYFGLGLEKFKRYKTVITLHWIRYGFLETISSKMICKKANVVVVNSTFLKKQLNERRLHNIVHIEYPQFNKIESHHIEACRFWGINEKIKTLACIGSTRYDKGIDILLDALNKVKAPFQLLIAGQPRAFDEEFINSKVGNYKKNVCLNLHYLSDEELSYAIAASDIIVLPYRKSFNGASGPLGEGVSSGKCILGANHGNLGFTILENHLGYTFDSESIDSLANTLELALIEDFKLDDKYIAFQKMLDPKLFKRAYECLYETLVKS